MTTPSAPRAQALQREIKQTRPFRTPAEEAFVAILRTADVLRRRLARIVEPRGITPQQYNVLRILRGAHPGSLPTLEIRERLIEQAPGITRLVDRLDRAGLIARERSTEDRRRVDCTITRAGLALLEELDTEIDAADEATAAGLSARQLEELLDTLAQIRSADA
jgi:MarR family transcriptional regulator, organic hydroperoxide resistance regulator